jgi:hypothetical protein
MSVYLKEVLRVGKVVCGNGPASVRVLQAFTPPKKRLLNVDAQLLRIGDHQAKDHSWQRTVGSLRMGQGTGMLLKNENLSNTFTKVHDFNERENRLAAQALSDNAGFDLPARVVQVIKIADNEILIRVLLPDMKLLEIVAQEVIFAQGAGLDREVDAPISRRSSLLQRPFGEYSTGSKSLTGVTHMISGSDILIVGDGPTALWNAEHYMNNGNEVFVVGPDSDMAFKSANPGGRNSEIYTLLLNQGRLLTATIEGIEERNQIREFGDPAESGILVYLKNQSTYGHGKRASAVMGTARVVSAIGSFSQTMQAFHPSILGSLETVLETGYGGTVAIGFATPNHDIVICGAQAVAEGVSRNQKALFDLAGSRIGQPPPGILTIEASIRSLQRIKQMAQLGADQADLLAMQDLLLRPDLDPYSANAFEFTRYFLSLGVHQAAAIDMAQAAIETRARYLKEGRVFNNLHMASITTALLRGDQV